MATTCLSHVQTKADGEILCGMGLHVQPLEAFWLCCTDPLQVVQSVVPWVLNSDPFPYGPSSTEAPEHEKAHFWFYSSWLFQPLSTTSTEKSN